MTLLFLYGIPGTGKLTVAKKIEEYLENYKLFDNHKTVDIISPIFPFASPKWMFLNGEYRRLMYEACAEEGVNLITTYVYAHVEDDQIFVRDIMNIFDKYGSEVLFVRLVCNDEIVFKRIQNPDRKKHRKVSDPKKLMDTMKKWDLRTPIPLVDSLTIDTGRYSADEAAKLIIKHYNLDKN